MGERRRIWITVTSGSLTTARLWGNPQHLRYIADSLREKHPEAHLHVLVAKSNSGNFTYDGIELGGERLTREIEDEIEKLEDQGTPIAKLSLVGYSLGGLVARYAIGLLYSRGLFDRIEPVVRQTCSNFRFPCANMAAELHDLCHPASR